MTDLQTKLSEARAAFAKAESDIAQALKEAKADGIAKVRALMSEHCLSLSDIGGKLAAVKAPAAAMYRNADGKVWGGKGKHPRWLADAIAAGAKKEDFKIAA
jgi:DNA-binding protein H-NS